MFSLFLLGYLSNSWDHFVAQKKLGANAFYLTFPNNVWASKTFRWLVFSCKNKPGPAQVGAISKAQK